MDPLTRSEEPQLPPIPAVGGQKRKDMEPVVLTVVACTQCHHEFTRVFHMGDHVYKRLDDEPCPRCEHPRLEIRAIYQEYRKKK